jgi:hypothetical protein
MVRMDDDGEGSEFELRGIAAESPEGETKLVGLWQMALHTLCRGPISPWE